MSGESARWRINLDADDATACAVLAADESWNGYGMSDPEPPYRAYAQAHGRLVSACSNSHGPTNQLPIQYPAALVRDLLMR